MSKTDETAQMSTIAERLYEQYSRFVYKEAWKYHSNGFEVDDLVQEVWMKLCGKAELLGGYSETQLAAYISIAVKNTAISIARKRHVVFSLEDADRIPYYETEIVHEVIDRKNKIHVFRSLWPFVPQKERELLERKYFLQESDVEIALEMNIHTNSVRMYLTRARKTAYEVLEKHKNNLL